MLRALALDCAAAAAVEELCDQIEGELQGQFPGCFFPFRYSPGYGDPAPQPPGAPAGPAGRPPENRPVRQRRSYLDPPEIRHRHFGGVRHPREPNRPKLRGLSRPERLPVSKVRWTLWNFLNC